MHVEILLYINNVVALERIWEIKFFVCNNPIYPYKVYTLIVKDIALVYDYCELNLLVIHTSAHKQIL